MRSRRKKPTKRGFANRNCRSCDGTGWRPVAAGSRRFVRCECWRVIELAKPGQPKAPKAVDVSRSRDKKLLAAGE
jgi:hypothetical protein